MNGFHLKRCYLPLPSECESDVETPASSEGKSSNLEVAVPGNSHSGFSQQDENTSSDPEIAAPGDFHSGSSNSHGSDGSIPLLPLPMPPLQFLPNPQNSQFAEGVSSTSTPVKSKPMSTPDASVEPPPKKIKTHQCEHSS